MPSPAPHPDWHAPGTHAGRSEEGLFVVERAPVAAAPAPAGGGSTASAPVAPVAPVAVLVHGSLDRGDSFRRVARRLEELWVVTYDRRGYQRSRDATAAAQPVGLAGHTAQPVGLAGHTDDLVALVRRLAGVHGPVVVVGHSFGGDVALGAALAVPDLVAAVAAYEPPVPWLGFTRPRQRPGPTGPPRSGQPSPGAEAERFFIRMLGAAAWDRLSADEQASRRLDGPALVTELRSIRGPAPWDVTSLAVPAVFGRGGPASQPHHRAGVAWLAEHVPGAQLMDLPTAGHGAHLSHPDAFAKMVRQTTERALAVTAQGGPAA